MPKAQETAWRWHKEHPETAKILCCIFQDYTPWKRLHKNAFRVKLREQLIDFIIIYTHTGLAESIGLDAILASVVRMRKFVLPSGSRDPGPTNQGSPSSSGWKEHGCFGLPLLRLPLVPAVNRYQAASLAVRNKVRNSAK